MSAHWRYQTGRLTIHMKKIAPLNNPIWARRAIAAALFSVFSLTGVAYVLHVMHAVKHEVRQ